jgi:hypothetical protein
MMRAPFSKTLIDLIIEQAERYPELPAVIDERGTLTYPQLRDRAFKVAAALREAGVGMGDQVGILINNRAEWIEVCLAVAAIGATAAPFSTWSTPRELDFLLRDSDARVLFMIDRFGERDYGVELAPLLHDPASRPPALEHIVSLAQSPTLPSSPARRRSICPRPASGRAVTRPLSFSTPRGPPRIPRPCPMCTAQSSKTGSTSASGKGCVPPTAYFCRFRCSGHTVRPMPWRPPSPMARRWCCKAGSIPRQRSHSSSTTAAPRFTPCPPSRMR